MQELKLISDIPPSVNHYLAYRAILKKGKPFAMSYKTQDSIQYRKSFAEYVTAEVHKQGWDLPLNPSQHFYVDAVFYFDRIDRDASNYWKVLLDAITDTQLIWSDDNVVCERVKRIFYDSENPRIELLIYPVDYIGIFDNASQLQEFTDNCIKCKRHSRGCSIYTKAVEGRIQKEVQNLHCIKFSEAKELKHGKESKD